MKTSNRIILVTIINTATAATALAQGTVVFENSFSTGNITLNSSAGAYAAAGSYTVALLWAPGNTLGLPQGAFTQIATFGPAGTSTGYFFDGVVTTPNGTAPGATAVFEVQGWQGNYVNYAAAFGGTGRVGQSAEFLNATGGAGSPPGNPVYLTIGNGGGWDGNLILTFGDPEPSTLAIAGLGAGVWLYFRRRNAVLKKAQ